MKVYFHFCRALPAGRQETKRIIFHCVKMIKKIKGKYAVLSETTGRVFGRYDTKQEAEKRLRQIEYFKRLKGKRKE